MSKALQLGARPSSVTDGPVAVRLVSFSYPHGPIPDAHIVLDLRTHFDDSPVRRGFIDLTDPAERAYALVTETDGLPELVEGVIPVLASFRSGCGSDDGPVTVAVGCADGQLSAAVAIVMQRRLNNGLVLVTVEHREPEG